MRFGLVLACGVLAPLLIAAAAEPVRLRPASPWIVDYEQDSCRLIRNFGEGKTLTKFVLESAAPDEMDMMITGKPLETFREQVNARFLPVGRTPFEGRIAETVTTHDPVVLASKIRMLPDSVYEQLEKEREAHPEDGSVRPPPIDLVKQESYKVQRQQFAAAVTELEIETRRNHSVILETGSLGDPMKVFEQCTKDSLKSWGVDPAVEEKIARPVWSPNPTGWLYSSDYPADMLSRGKESEVTVRLLIDAAGKATGCTSLSHFAEVEFNRITCALIVKRARFAPAELADGTKVPSYLTRRVVFRIGR